MAKSPSKKIVPEVIDVGQSLVVSEDEQFVEEAGRQVVGFMASLGAFFQTATSLERTALGTQIEARHLKVPTNGDEDAAVQRFVKRTLVEKNEVETHWKITTAVNAFHRRMTAARGRATSALEEANATGNRLHNQYADNEKRRIARENEERRLAEERKAQQERDAELVRMEAEATAKEEAAAGLSERETMFVDLYYAHGDGLRAAKSAGFKNPLKDSARLLTLPKIAQAIQAKREAAEIRRQAEATKRAPLITDDFEPAKADVQQVGAERTTTTVEVLDELALLEAFRSSKFGIPASIFTVKQAAINAEGRSLGEMINRWPGVRLKKNTKVT